MIVLITGDTGFIGTNLKQFLMKKNVKVNGFSRNEGFNVLNLEQVINAVRSVELVFHLAAEAKPAESVSNPIETIETNIRGSLNVFEACKKHKVPLIYASSCEIYGDSIIPINEEHSLNPTNPYAASKSAIDRICYTYYKSYGLNVKIVRLFNPFGPYQHLNKIIPTFYIQAKKGIPITIYGDGKDTRDYTYIDDIVHGLWLSRDLPAGETINLATGKATTSLEVSKKIIEVTGSKSPIIFMDYPKLFGGIMHQIGSYEKAKKLLNWAPKSNFKDNLIKTTEWLNNR